MTEKENRQWKSNDQLPGCRAEKTKDIRGQKENKASSQHDNLLTTPTHANWETKGGGGNWCFSVVNLFLLALAVFGLKWNE